MKQAIAQKINAKIPRPGYDGICPHCDRPTRFLHVEQFPGDAPFIAYLEPLEKQKKPIVQVRKSRCTNEGCQKLIVTLEMPEWVGMLVPFKQIK